MITQYVRYTPIGEYIRLIVLRRLAHGPAKVEEIDQMVEEAVRRLHVRYDWRVWPRLVKDEVEIRGDVAIITQRGKWILEQTGDEVAKYVEKMLGVTL
jgi:hypothetical protein